MASQLESARYAGNGFVDGTSNSWFIFGGYQNSLQTVQRYDIDTQSWTKDVGLFQDKQVWNHCIVKVNLSFKFTELSIKKFSFYLCVDNEIQCEVSYNGFVSSLIEHLLYIHRQSPKFFMVNKKYFLVT